MTWAEPVLRAPWAGLPGALAVAPVPDDVELKVLVADDGNTAALAEIVTGLSTARVRTLHLVDSPAGTLNRAGLVLRLRSAAQPAGRGADAAVKWRPAPDQRPDGAELVRWRRAFPTLRTELDALPDAATWTAAVVRAVSGSAVAAVARGRRDVASILSPEQLRLVLTVSPQVHLHRLRPVAAVTVVRARLAGTAARVVVEVCRYADGRQVVELSTRCTPVRAAWSATQLGRVLDGCGLVPARQQRFKTGGFPRAGFTTSRWTSARAPLAGRG